MKPGDRIIKQGTKRRGTLDAYDPKQSAWLVCWDSGTETWEREECLALFIPAKPGRKKA